MVTGFHTTSEHFCYGRYCHACWVVATHNLVARVMLWWRHTPVGTVDSFHGYKTVTSRDGGFCSALSYFQQWQTPLTHRKSFWCNICSWQYMWGTRWRSWLMHCARSRKVAGSIPYGVIGTFHWHNPSDRTVALGSTQPLTAMLTTNISWSVKAAGALGWQPYHLLVPIV
jgi:hypothetical protein